jgi:hypothetical protein
VITPIYGNDIGLEKMKLGRIDVIFKDFNMWKEYRDKLQQLKTI